MRVSPYRHQVIESDRAHQEQHGKYDRDISTSDIEYSWSSHTSAYDHEKRTEAESSKENPIPPLKSPIAKTEPHRGHDEKPHRPGYEHGKILETNNDRVP
jgi:hypothetical protein